MNAEIERADAVIPGACFGYTRLPDDLAFIASHGQGSHLFSTGGADYLDYTLGSGPLLLGHAHPRITEAICRQAERGTHFYAMNGVAVELAEKIVDSLPRGEAVKFCADGSQATFFAMRLARARTGRETILKFEGAYHGHHDYALVGFPGSPDRREGGTIFDGIPVGATRKVVTATFNDLASAADVAHRHREDLAAIIVEPVQRALPPGLGFLQGLRDLADELGALLIFDEVVTGFRLARGGAQELYGVEADLTALGKATGGGTALGAVTGPRSIVDQLVPAAPGANQQVFMSGTLNGNPLGAAAGLAMLTELEDIGAPALIAEHVAILRDGLEAQAATRGIQLQTVGPDVFFDVCFGARGPVTDLTSYGTADREASLTFGTELLRQGIYVVPGGKFYVSAVHTADDADRFLSASDAALGQVAAKHPETVR